MKKTFAFIVTMVLCLGIVSPALAFTGVSGVVVDSVLEQPWVWGGDVMIINQATGSIVATCMLDSTGNIVAPGPLDCDYGTAYLFPASPIPPVAGNQISIFIDFSCAISGACSGGSNGTPESLVINYTEAVATAPYPILAFPANGTGTGPNAVDLAGMSSTSRLSIALVMAAFAGGSMLLKKKASKEQKATYQSPEIVHEGQLEVQAGSIVEDITFGLFEDLQ